MANLDPVYTGEQPGSIRKLLGQLLGVEEGLDRYENVYPEGTPSYDRAGDGYSGSVNPIGRRAIRYGDAPVTKPMPLDLEEDTAQFDPNVMPTGEEMTEEQFMAGQPATGKFSDIPEPGIKPQYRGDGRESIRDANTRLTATQDVGYQVPNAPMDLTGEEPLDLTKHSAEFSKNVGPIKPIVQIPDVDQGGNQAGFVQEATPENPSGAVSLSRRGSLMAGLNNPPAPPPAETLPVEPTNPGSRVIPGKWAGVPKRSAFSNNPYYTGDDMGDLNDIDPGSLNPPGGGMDITGEEVQSNFPAKVPQKELPGVGSLPPPPQKLKQPPIPLQDLPNPRAVSGGGAEITPTPLPMNPHDAQQGGFNLMDTIMSMISRDDGAVGRQSPLVSERATGQGRGIPSIMKTLMNPQTRIR